MYHIEPSSVFVLRWSWKSNEQFLSCAVAWDEKPDLTTLLLSKINAGRVKSAEQRELLSPNHLIGSNLFKVTPTREKLETTLLAFKALIEGVD